jgi:hypothetical protein
VVRRRSGQWVVRRLRTVLWRVWGAVVSPSAFGLRTPIVVVVVVVVWLLGRAGRK